MKNRLTAGKLLVVSGAILLTSLLSSPLRAAADTTTQPLQITPICASFSDNVAKWNVTNPNTSSVSVTWTNSAQGTGTTTVTAGQTVPLQTTYSSRGQTVKFVANGVAQVISNLANQTDGNCVYHGGTSSPVITSLPSCIPVDYQTLRNYLTYTWTGKNKVTVGTINNTKLCAANVSLNLSSYVMPTNYNGDFFTNNPTVLDQTLFNNDTESLTNVTTPATYGTYATTKTQPVTLTVNLPADCNNVQTDLYTGPVIQALNAATPGTPTYLAGGIYQRTSTCEGGKGGETPTTPQVQSAATVAQLTDTGLNIWVTSLLAAATMASAIFVARKKTVSNQ